MKNFASAIFLLFLLSITGFAQTPTPTPVDDDEKEIIRISSELVLTDALVLDKDGKQVTDLTAEDFEVLQDGKPQKITSFGYYTAGKTTADNQSQQKTKTDKKALPLPPVSVRSNQGRIITFILDDGNCFATPIGLSNARDGMKKFIDEQMLPDDKVAIYRTRGGSSLLQMYTSNKEVLKSIVNKVSWFPGYYECGSFFVDAKNDSINRSNPNSGSGGLNTNDNDKQFKKAIASDNTRYQTFGMIQVFDFVIDRLKNLPQRKVVFFISEGIQIPLGGEVIDSLRVITDKASRSSVTIYTMSEKGLTVPGMIEAADNVLPSETTALSEGRMEEERNLNDGLAYLAYSTGGRFIRNMNKLEKGIRDVLDQERGYYLIGYQPDDETFKGKEFHKIEVKLKRDDLKISSRKGFFGRTETETRPKLKTENTSMYQAISSPFRENGMDIRLTMLVENTPAEGGLIRALFHVKGQDLTFTDEADGTKKVVLDVVAVLFDEKGKVVEEFNRTYPIRIPKQGVQTVLQNGLDYSTDIPVKKSGFYSLRLAVRDTVSKRLGSAGDFIEIPNVKKGGLVMSGLVTTDITKAGKPLLPKTRLASAAFAPVFVSSIPSIRQYQAGTLLAYIYNIYNAKPDAATKQPKLTKQVRLYKDGKLLVDTGEKPLEIQPQADASRISDYAFLRLNQDMETGEYILQVVIRDTAANKTASQWIDFEIVK
jgi:VWFA-related protein